ncbi:MAG: acetyl-CoA carboxylase biotin carboxyl carrier protein, partial [Pseudomonadota bacterium]
MDIRKIKKLIELVEESGIAELEITEGEESVRINRNNMSAGPAYAQFAPQQYAPAPAPAAAPAAPVAESEAPAAGPTGHQVKSPMVGSFYAA